MTSEERNKLIDKYYAGETSLEEEKELLNQADLDTDLSGLSGFIKHKQQQVPKDLNSNFWQSVEKEKKQKHYFRWTLSGIAASITLIFIVVLFQNKQEQQQTAAVFKEALSMFPDETIQNEAENDQIVYEDEIIMIYYAEK